MATVSDITTTPLSGLNYIDALLDTTRTEITDAYVAIDVGKDGYAGELSRLYSAAFGFGYWLSRMEHGTSFAQVSREFMADGNGSGQAEFVWMYGANSSNETFPGVE